MSNTILACLEGDKKGSPLLIQHYEMPTASKYSSYHDTENLQVEGSQQLSQSYS